MTDWKAVAESDWAVPEGASVSELVDELCHLLASPDPVERDQQGYSTLATWLSRGVLDTEQCLALGDEMARRFESPDVCTRTFAPLVLDCLVTFGTFRPEWVEPFARWYPAETDLRGFDPDLGWLHAVAHGADLLGALGRHPEVAPQDMLELAARRLTAPTDTVWRDGEDERLGFAIALTLTRAELDIGESTGWLDALVTSWQEAPAPPPPFVRNGSHTLRVLLGFCLTGVRPYGHEEALPLTHASEVREAVLAALHTLTPGMW